MKGMRIVLPALMCVAAIFFVQAGFSQAVKNQPIPTQTSKLVKIIKDCYVPYIDTKKLYAEGGQAYLVPPEVDEGKLYADDGKKYLIPFSPAVGEEQNLADTTKGREYHISREVEVKEVGKRGVQLNIQTIAASGYITKADVFIIKDRVVKIIILDMEQ